MYPEWERWKTFPSADELNVSQSCIQLQAPYSEKEGSTECSEEHGHPDKGTWHEDWEWCQSSQLSYKCLKQCHVEQEWPYPIWPKGWDPDKLVELNSPSQQPELLKLGFWDYELPNSWDSSVALVTIWQRDFKGIHVRLLNLALNPSQCFKFRYFSNTHMFQLIESDTCLFL